MEYYKMENAKNISKEIWYTQDGRAFQIDEMDTQHIIFSLNKCIKENWRVRFIPLFKEELKNRREEN